MKEDIEEEAIKLEPVRDALDKLGAKIVAEDEEVTDELIGFYLYGNSVSEGTRLNYVSSIRNGKRLVRASVLAKVEKDYPDLHKIFVEYNVMIGAGKKKKKHGALSEVVEDGYFGGNLSLVDYEAHGFEGDQYWMCPTVAIMIGTYKVIRSLPQAENIFKDFHAALSGNCPTLLNFVDDSYPIRIPRAVAEDIYSKIINSQIIVNSFNQVLFTEDKAILCWDYAKNVIRVVVDEEKTFKFIFS